MTSISILPITNSKGLQQYRAIAGLKTELDALVELELMASAHRLESQMT